MNFGLSDQDLVSIRQVFSQEPAVQKVLVYGSRAKGNYRPGSDIDLTLIGADLDEKTLSRMDERFEELLLPYRFDLSIYDRIDHPELIDHIQRIGKIFYEKSGLDGEG